MKIHIVILHIFALLFAATLSSAASAQTCQLLCNSARNGDVNAVNSAIMGGANVNAKDANGHTPLYIAAQNERTSVVIALLAANADPNIVSGGDNETPLLIAADFVVLEMVNALLSVSGIMVNLADRDGVTPLHRAAESGGVAVVNALLGATGINVDATDDDGETPLHYAAANGRPRSGGNIGADSAAVINALITAGAGLEIKSTNFGRTPLISAVRRAPPLGHVMNVQALIDGGADVNATDTSGRTPLFSSLNMNQSEYLQALLAATGIDVNAKNNDGETALHVVADAAAENLPSANALIAAGINVNAEDNSGETAYNKATARGHAGIVAALDAAIEATCTDEQNYANGVCTPICAAPSAKLDPLTNECECESGYLELNAATPQSCRLPRDGTDECMMLHGDAMPVFDDSQPDNCRPRTDNTDCPTDAPYFDSAETDLANQCRLPTNDDGNGDAECASLNSGAEPVFDDSQPDNCRPVQIYSDCKGADEVFVETPVPACVSAQTFLTDELPISEFYTAESCAEAGWNVGYIARNSATQSGAAEICEIPVMRENPAPAIAAGNAAPQLAPGQSANECIMRAAGFSATANMPNCNDPQFFGDERFPRIPPGFDTASHVLILAGSEISFNGAPVMRLAAAQSSQTVARTGGGNGSGGKFIFSGIGLFWAIYSWQNGSGAFNFSPDVGYAFTESGYSANAAGQLNFRDENLHIYWRAGQQNTNGDFGNLHYESGGKYKKDFWSATFSETIAGETANYDFSLSADLQGGIWKISPTYRMHSRWAEKDFGIETETRNELNLEGVLRYNRWTINPSAGFRWENAANFADSGKFRMNAIYRF